MGQVVGEPGKAICDREGQARDDPRVGSCLPSQGLIAIHPDCLRDVVVEAVFAAAAHNTKACRLMEVSLGLSLRLTCG